MPRIKNNPKDILNNLKWNRKYNFENVEIWYLHRGASNDTKIISADEIISLGKSFIKTGSAMIPYHRVLRIIYENEVVFSRKK